MLEGFQVDKSGGFIMILKEFYDFVINRKRKNERVKSVKKFAVGISVIGAGIGTLFTIKQSMRRKDMDREELNTVEKIKNAVEAEKETIKKSAANVNNEIGEAAKDVQEIAENVKEDMQDGFHKTKKDIHKTKKNIQKTLHNVSKELDKL
jgi:peptidoglycan hydrolase CwlO-like protein